MLLLALDHCVLEILLNTVPLMGQAGNDSAGSLGQTADN